MSEIKNIEMKARCSNPEKIRNILKENNAEFMGVDGQKDTYFHVPKGRLKLREGNIENSLIFYDRAEVKGLKESNIALYKTKNDSGLSEVLSSALGIKVVVEKKREIYFIQNVKFHVDEVKDLGGFVEIEAIDEDGSFSVQELQAQCQHYVDLFGVGPEEFIDKSYSDMILEKQD